MTRLLEYEGKRLLKETGISVPDGETATTPSQARKIAERLASPVAIKAQIGATGRFKAGGIKFARSPSETQIVAGEILGKTIKGINVEKVLVEKQLEVTSEFYASVIVDDSYKTKGPALMLSTEGGVDIEEVALQHPERVRRRNIPILEGITIKEIADVVESFNLPRVSSEQLSQIALGVYQVFKKYDARSVEINPIALSSDGTAYAADCRVVLDEASVFRHPDLGITFPRDLGRTPTQLERIAWRIEENDYRGISYFAQMTEQVSESAGYVGFHGIGGGAAMLGADALMRQGLRIANYADTSGNPTASKVYRTVKVILSQPNIEGYVLMGAVLANQEQWHHANALVRALREDLPSRPNFPVVLLIAGNKEAESIEILKEGLKDFPAQIELFGRDYVYNVDYVAQRVKHLVEESRRIRKGMA